MMGRKDLGKRNVWQDKSGEKAASAEALFVHAFHAHFDKSEFFVKRSPTDFKKIYVDYPLADSVLAEIYTPEVPVKLHGITPDFAIGNQVTGKTLYVEMKRQDGWVEGKSRAHGRGNAHERCCKYFTPGLLKILRKKGGMPKTVLPFWTVFVGDITRDPCRVREISCWFAEYPAHYFFWRDTNDANKLLTHFEQNLKHLLG